MRQAKSGKSSWLKVPTEVIAHKPRSEEGSTGSNFCVGALRSKSVSRNESELGSASKSWERVVSVSRYHETYNRL